MSDDNNNTAVVISFADLYKQLVEISGELRSVSEMVKQSSSVASDHEARLRALEKIVSPTYEKRLAELEKWRYALPSSLIMSAVAILFGLWLHYH